MISCVILLWPSKIKCSLILMQNMFNVWVLMTNWLKNLFLEDLGWIQVFLKKLLISYSCISFMKHCAFRSFCINCSIFQKFEFSKFSTDRIVSQPIENAIKTYVTIGLAWLVLDWLNLIFNRSKLIFDQSKFES